MSPFIPSLIKENYHEQILARHIHQTHPRANARAQAPTRRSTPNQALYRTRHTRSHQRPDARFAMALQQRQTLTLAITYYQTVLLNMLRRNTPCPARPSFLSGVDTFVDKRKAPWHGAKTCICLSVYRYTYILLKGCTSGHFLFLLFFLKNLPKLCSSRILVDSWTVLPISPCLLGKLLSTMCGMMNTVFSLQAPCLLGKLLSTSQVDNVDTFAI